MKIPRKETTFNLFYCFPSHFVCHFFFFLFVIKLLLWIEKSSCKADCPSHQGLKNKILIKCGVQSYQLTRQLAGPETQGLLSYLEIHNTWIKRQHIWVSCESRPIMYKCRTNVPVSCKSRSIEWKLSCPRTQDPWEVWSWLGHTTSQPSVSESDFSVEVEKASLSNCSTREGSVHVRSCRAHPSRLAAHSLSSIDAASVDTWPGIRFQ